MSKLSIVLAGVLVVGSQCLNVHAAEVAEPIIGTWSLNNWIPGDSVNLKLSYHNASTHWVWGNDQPIADLHGLTAEQLHATHAVVAFTIDRDAGSFSLKGTVTLGIGRGEFQFVPNGTYVAKLGVLGYENVGDVDLFAMTIRDISLAYASEVKLSGLKTVAVSDLVRLKDHGVSLEFIRQLATSGYASLTADDLVRFQDHGVDAGLMRALKQSGYPDLTAEEIVRLHDHGVDSGFVTGLAAAGHQATGVDDMIRLHDHGVDPQYVARIQSAGYKDLTVEQIIKLHDHGVD